MTNLAPPLHLTSSCGPQVTSGMDSSIRVWHVHSSDDLLEASQRWAGPGTGGAAAFPTRHIQNYEFFTSQARRAGGRAGSAGDVPRPRFR